MANKKQSFDLNKLPSPVVEHIMQLERVRRDFVANVSHELRTPLTVIRGYLDVMAGNESDEVTVPKEICQQMLEHSARMESIIKDLLLLSALESEEQDVDTVEEVFVAPMLKSLCNDARQISHEQHDIQCEVDESLTLRGSEKELKSLFSNLIINAVKYTPEGGRIDVSWSLENGHKVFKVQDTGIGIDQAHIPRLTERFYRVDKARSRDSGGTGLGLAIVKHVLMRHHGELSIESEPDQGSSFICTFYN